MYYVLENSFFDKRGRPSFNLNYMRFSSLYFNVWGQNNSIAPGCGGKLISICITICPAKDYFTLPGSRNVISRLEQNVEICTKFNTFQIKLAALPHLDDWNMKLYKKITACVWRDSWFGTILYKTEYNLRISWKVSMIYVRNHSFLKASDV